MRPALNIVKGLTPSVAEGLQKREKGQAVVLFAVVISATVLFFLVILDYMATNARVMETVAVADLAAHAGAQEITVLPDGSLKATDQGKRVAAQYFNAQRPSHAQLLSVSCGQHQERAACMITAQTRSAGYIIPGRWITVRAIGYMAQGVTRGDQ